MEELKTKKEWMTVGVNDHIVAIDRITRTLKRKGFGKGNGVTINQPCPLCGNNLIVAVNNYNGHTSGKCTTTGCLNWMQ